MIPDCGYGTEPVDDNEGKGSGTPQAFQATSLPEETKTPDQEEETRDQPEPGNQFSGVPVNHVSSGLSLYGLIERMIHSPRISCHSSISYRSVPRRPEI